MQIKITLRYHLKPVRMAIIKKARNSECWQAYGEKETLRHCWWQCEMVPPLVAQRVKNPSVMQETQETWMGLIPGLERSPGGGNGNLLQYSFLGNPMDRGA